MGPPWHLRYATERNDWGTYALEVPRALPSAVRGRQQEVVRATPERETGSTEAASTGTFAIDAEAPICVIARHEVGSGTSSAPAAPFVEHPSGAADLNVSRRSIR